MFQFSVSKLSSVCVCVCMCVCVCFLGPNQKTNLLRYGGPSMVTCGNLVGSEDQLFSCATTQGASNARLLSGKISGWPVVKWDTVVKYGINIPVRWICYGSGHNEVTLIQKIHPHKIQRQNGPRKTSCKWGEMPYNPRELRVQFRPFLGVRTPFMTGAHLVRDMIFACTPRSIITFWADMTSNYHLPGQLVLGVLFCCSFCVWTCLVGQISET